MCVMFVLMDRSPGLGGTLGGFDGACWMLFSPFSSSDRIKAVKTESFIRFANKTEKNKERETESKIEMSQFLYVQMRFSYASSRMRGIRTLSVLSTK